MKKGQTIIIGIFVFLILVSVVTFSLYYFDFSITGSASDRKVTLIDKGELADNLLVPKSVYVMAIIGETSEEEFIVKNYNRNIVNVRCFFPPFQEGVPSSQCYTYDSEGRFVGSEKSVSIGPGQEQVFMASVRPYNGIRIERQNSPDRLITISTGEYQRDIELRVSDEDNQSSVSVISVPVKIDVIN